LSTKSLDFIEQLLTKLQFYQQKCGFWEKSLDKSFLPLIFAEFKTSLLTKTQEK